MTKIKKLKMQYKIVLGLLVVVAIVGVGLGVRAYVSNEAPKYVVEGNMVVNEAPAVVEPDEEMFGALTSPDITSPYLSVNEDVTYHITGDFTDATTTIMAITNPFLMATTTTNDIVVAGTYPYAQTGATSTVELIRLNITGVATTTYVILCGASATNGATGSSTIAYHMLTSDSIATSTFKGAIENDITSSYGAAIGGGSVPKIMLDAFYPYLVCTVVTKNNTYDGAFTEVTNTFDGKFMVRISKTRF